MDERRIQRMRENLQRAASVLKAEGWTQGEFALIGPAIQRAIQAGDDDLLECWYAWIEQKAWSLPDGVVAISLADMERDAKAANAEWVRHGRPGPGRFSGPS